MDIHPFIWLLGTTAALPAAGVVGAYGVKMHVQRQADNWRRRYRVIAPYGPHSDWYGFWGSAGGFSGTKPWIQGLPSVAFETIADHLEIKQFLSAPNGMAGDFVKQLRSHVPGISVQPDEDDSHVVWDEAWELRLTSQTIPLHIPDPEVTIKSLLAHFGGLKEGQQRIWQLVMASAPPRPHSTNPKDKHNDLPLFIGVARMGARAETKAEARALNLGLFRQLSALKASGVAWQRRQIHPSLLMNRIYRRSSVISNPVTLNHGEVATLTMLPFKGINQPGLPSGRTRSVPPSLLVPQGPFVLGTSDFDGAERAVGQAVEDRLTHQYILGPTGTGKSTLIINEICQDWIQGYGNMFIDPHGQTADLIIDRVPKSRYEDVIILDPTNLSMAVGINPLEGQNQYTVAQQGLSIGDAAWDGISSMPRTGHYYRMGLLALAELKLTMMDMPVLFESTERGKDFRAWAIRSLKDPITKNFLRDFDVTKKVSQQIDETGPLMNRLNNMRMWPSVRGMLGQTKSALNFDDIMATNKIVIVSLNRRTVGDDAAKFIGLFLVNKLRIAAMGRPPGSKPYFCYIDEAHEFFRMPVGIADALAESRKFGLGFILANQDLNQLGTQRDAIMAGCRSKVFFQPASASEAHLISRELTPHFTPDDLMNLATHQVIMKLAARGQVAAPFTASTLEPFPALGSAREVTALSQSQYATPVSQVDDALNNRHNRFRTPREKPSVGWVEDDNEPV